MENICIRKCGFSTRLENVLWNANYKTTDDLLKMPIEEFLVDMKYWPNFGKKSALEYKEWLYSIKAFNCSNFKKELEQLTELYELKANVNSLIIEKQKQLDILLLNIEPA
jgi:DNA-directed RNA polymerase alpha subunit